MDVDDQQHNKRPASNTSLEHTMEHKKPKLEHTTNNDTKPRRYDQLKDVAGNGQLILQEAQQLLQNLKSGKSNKNDVNSMIQKMISENQKFVDALNMDIVQTKSDTEKNNDMGVIIKNLPDDWNRDRLHAFLSKKDLKFLEMEKEEGSTKAKVLFKTLDDEERLFRELDGFKIQTKWLGVYKNTAPEQIVEEEEEVKETPPRSLRGGKAGQAVQVIKKKGFSSDGGQSRDIRDMVTPYWQIPYKEQLILKHKKLIEELERVTDNAKWVHAKNNRPQWLDAVLSSTDEEQSEGVICCPIEGILQSPQLVGYRNKTEFTIGYNLSEKPTIGFLLGSFKAGITAVSDASTCPNISSLTIQFADIVQDFVRNQSKFKPWDKRVNEGFWRLLIVREARKKTFLPLPGGGEYQDQNGGEITFKNLEWQKWMVKISDGDQLQTLQTDQEQFTSVEDVKDQRMQAPQIDEAMLVIQINPKSIDKEEVQQEMIALEKHIRQKIQQQNIQCQVVLLLQYHTGVSNSAPVSAPLLPFPSESEKDVKDLFVTDSLLDLKFLISYQAFFQVNSGAASCLYSLVGQWANVGSKTLLLDICCGTGTIGLTMAQMAKKVIGIDNAQSAIQDAKLNSKLNKMDNCHWICGTAESKIKNVLKEHENQIGPEKEFEDIVAIVDPPRAGLHKSVISAILNCPHVKRLVYVSCNPESLSGNMVKLCSIRQYNANDPNWKEYIPFSPMKAVAVDLFPQTKHCEGIVLLQRD